MFLEKFFHILGLSGSPFHHVYHINSDFKRIFPDLTHDFKTFFNNSSDERLWVDIKYRFLTSKFDTGRVKLIIFFLWGANYHFDTAEFSS